MSNDTYNESDCLLVIDVQNDFCENGALAVPDANSIVPIVNALIPKFSTIVLTQDWHPAGHSSFASEHSGKNPLDTVTFPYGEQTLWPDHCVQGSHGAEFHAELNTHAAQMIVRKGFRKPIDSYSAFFENDQSTATGLSGYLNERGIKRVFCAGLATDFCVRFSAEDALKQGFDTTLITAACRGIDIAGSVDASISSLQDAGVIIDQHTGT